MILALRLRRPSLLEILFEHFAIIALKEDWTVGRLSPLATKQFAQLLLALDNVNFFLNDRSSFVA